VRGRAALVLTLLTLSGCTTGGPPPAAPAPEPESPDPNMAVDCRPEPNRPPSCTQGDYDVIAPIDGESCAPAHIWRAHLGGTHFVCEEAP
jgi:hypothetical protein